MRKRLSILIFVLLIAAISCVKIESLPDVPMVEFRSFSIYDTIDILGNPAKAGTITFYFEDGDGDLGLADPGTGETTVTSNLFFKAYRRVNNDFVPIEMGDDLYPSEYRIPYMEASGQNKILRGTIDVTMVYFFYSTTDTIYYDFWVRDREGHDSNTDSTCVVVIGENGTCARD